MRDSQEPDRAVLDDQLVPHLATFALPIRSRMDVRDQPTLGEIEDRFVELVTGRLLRDEAVRWAARWEMEDGILWTTWLGGLSTASTESIFPRFDGDGYGRPFSTWSLAELAGFLVVEG